MISLPWIPLGVIGLVSWTVWFIRRHMSHHHYSEIVNDSRCPTPVIVPVFRTISVTTSS